MYLRAGYVWQSTDHGGDAGRHTFGVGAVHEDDCRGERSCRMDSVKWGANHGRSANAHRN